MIDIGVIKVFFFSAEIIESYFWNLRPYGEANGQLSIYP